MVDEVITRRGFLGLLGVGAVGLALPNLELFTPNRTFFLPPVGGWSRGYRELYKVTAAGYAQASLPGALLISRPHTLSVPLLQCGLNAYGGLLHIRLPLGEEIVDLPEHPLEIKTTDPTLEWQAFYKTDRGFEMESGYGEKRRALVRL